MAPNGGGTFYTMGQLQTLLKTLSDREPGNAELKLAYNLAKTLPPDFGADLPSDRQLAVETAPYYGVILGPRPWPRG